MASTVTAPVDHQRLDSPAYRRWVLFILLIVYMVNFIDRSILNTVGQAVKADLKLTDLELGLLGGLAFAVVNGTLAVPIARLAERYSRVKIIAISVAVWSAFTAVCGLAGNFWHMLVARIGVGVGEAGGAAPVQSLISDYYPPEKRATALSIYVTGVPIGILLGAAGSGWLVENMSWRTAFMVVGLPGILLAVVVWATIIEPPRGYAEKAAPSTEPPPPLMAVVRRMLGRRSLVHMILGGIIANFAAYGALQFTHPYFVRQYHLGYAEAALMFGLMVSITSLIGFLLGGIGTDRLATRDKRWYAWVPALGMIAATPLIITGLAQPSFWMMFVILMLPNIGVSTYFGPTFASIHNMVDPRMRASATALGALGMNLIGAAFGPVLAGWLSDVFARGAYAGDFAVACPGGAAPADALPDLVAACQQASATGLQHALMAMAVFYLWAGLHYLLASRSIRRDLAM
ncbi:spinster family MFS transporter [Zavarzinia sp. CC-PAN008]|uniref:spinster family MFS transporter n=1 Tax=Zavarzinia sp. CC-PAN008 TaxID=3243332 RepID=UPI003F747F87